MRFDHALGPRFGSSGHDGQNRRAKVRGHFDAEGTAHFDGANPKNSSVRVTLDVNSVNTGNADRDPLLPADPFAAVNRRIAITVLRDQRGTP